MRQASPILLLLSLPVAPCAAQPGAGVAVHIDVVPVEELYLADFDPAHPELAPVVLTITLLDATRVVVHVRGPGQWKFSIMDHVRQVAPAGTALPAWGERRAPRPAREPGSRAY